MQISWSQLNWDMNIGVGMPFMSQNLMFYNPSTTPFKGFNFISKENFKPGLTAGVGFKRHYEWLRFDAGIQAHQYGFSYVPILESTSQPTETNVGLYSMNIYGVLNFEWKNLALGVGPNIVYLTKPKIESSMDVMDNMKVISLYSLGLKFNLDYSFRIKSRDFILGYCIDRNRERSQLRATLVYNHDTRDFYYLEIPTRFHYIRLAYVFK